MKWPKTQTSADKVLASIFWDVQGILFIDYLEKGRTINSKYYLVLLVHLKEEIAKKQQQMKKKSALSPRHCIVSQVDRYDSKTTWIALWIASALTLFSRSGEDLFADLKRMLQGKRFGSNEEVLLETEAFFEAKDKSSYKKGIKMLEKCWNQCITLECNYVDE